MKKAYLYVFAIMTASIIYVTPNLNFLLADVSTLKKEPQVTTSTEESPVTESNPLPSFLESSSGVLESTDKGFTGSADPTVPLAYTDTLVEKALQNDIDIYGAEIDEEAKKELINKVLGNAELDTNITNNATNNESETVTVEIRVVKSLAEFCGI